MKLLKCPKCGELFSDSYKECPFCAEDEELAQGGKARHGRRIQRQKSPSIGGPVLVIPGGFSGLCLLRRQDLFSV